MTKELMTPCEIRRKQRNESIIASYREKRKRYDYKVSDDRIYRILASQYKVAKETIRRVVSEAKL